MPKSLTIVEHSRLHPLGMRKPIPGYLSDLWARRDFIFTEGRNKAFATGRDTYLGKAWIILEPLFQVSVYLLVFGLIIKTSRGIDNFIGFLILGVIFFGFVSKGISNGSLLIQRSSNLIGSFTFPRAAIVISSCYRQFLDSITPALVAISLALLSQPGEPLSATILLAVPIFLLIHIFNLGIAFFVARMTAIVPDIKSLISLVNRALFFTSGVFFEISRFDANPILMKIVELSPVYQFLSAIRESVLYGTVPSFYTWIYLSCWSFGLLILGFVYFWFAEERYSSVR
ncbi:ABC transporter permease [Corynebacterium casei]|uniref:ABC transporter permease n=1 Tax=Corynebacterium casei TaxID=160386 RepID=UPI003FD09C00